MRTAQHVDAIARGDMRACHFDTGFYFSKKGNWKTLKKSMHR